MSAQIEQKSYELAQGRLHIADIILRIRSTARFAVPSPDPRLYYRSRTDHRHRVWLATEGDLDADENEAL
jgi:hypothetical protein